MGKRRGEERKMAVGLSACIPFQPPHLILVPRASPGPRLPSLLQPHVLIPQPGARSPHSRPWIPELRTQNGELKSGEPKTENSELKARNAELKAPNAGSQTQKRRSSPVPLWIGPTIPPTPHAPTPAPAGVRVHESRERVLLRII